MLNDRVANGCVTELLVAGQREVLQARGLRCKDQPGGSERVPQLHAERVRRECIERRLERFLASQYGVLPRNRRAEILQLEMLRD